MLEDLSLPKQLLAMTLNTQALSSCGNGIAKWEATKQDNVSPAPFGAMALKGH